jgi:hypothetical protein
LKEFISFVDVQSVVFFNEKNNCVRDKKRKEGIREKFGGKALG